MTKRFIILLLSLSFIVSIGNAQEKIKSLEISTSFGVVTKHSPQFVINPAEKMTWQVALAYYVRNVSSNTWRQKAKYPEFGINLSYTNFNNENVYGAAIAFYPTVKFNFPKQKLWNGYFIAGSGFAYLNKYYNGTSNAENTAIGSRLNNITTFKLGLDYNPGRVTIFVNGGLTHFSNAAVTQPNLGLNFFNATVGLRYHFNTFQLPEVQEITKPDRRWAFSIKASIGVYDIEQELFDDANHYFVANSFTTHAIFRTSIINQVFTGFKYTMNHGQKAYKGKAAFHNLSWQIGDEVRLGRVGIFGTVGLYLYNKYDPPSIVYAELGVNVYVVETKKSKGFIGINLKSHFAQAEYPELSLGWTVF